MVKLLSVGALLVAFSAPLLAAEVAYEDHDGMLMDHGEGHLMDMAGGMVMGQNASTLPGGCESISETKEITVHAGHKYAEKFPGRMYAFDKQEFNFKPCTKLTVHFINEDHVRHQWMMHGLPKYLYPKGMFHLEASGPSKISGTLILPPGDKTYLVHCDIAQHMEKGMKAQLKVGKGDGDLPSIPGVTAFVVADDYKATLPELAVKAEAQAKVDDVAAVKAAVVAKQAAADKLAGIAPPPTTPVALQDDSFLSGTSIIGLALGVIIAPFLARKFKGMSVSEVVAYSFELIGTSIAYVVKLLTGLISLIMSKKTKILPNK
ncbi:MAG: copper oxidase [Methylococcales bacterium]|nr:copper oxidase [Methylococcales bacterium]